MARSPLLIVIALVALTCWRGVSLAEASKQQQQQPPNFIFIMTDDQDKNLNSLAYTPLTKAFVGEQGAEFTNVFSSTPLCCPSRASFLTGQFEHNHKISDNNIGVDNTGCFTVFSDRHQDELTLATVMQQYGYETAIMGKYLNDYLTVNVSYVPPGWNTWFVFNEDTMGDYYNTSVSNNSQLLYFNGQYQTDFLAEIAEAWITAQTSSQKPFFLFLTPHAPHQPATPANRHENLFPGLAAPRTPSYNESEATQQYKPAWIRTLPFINSTELAGGYTYEDSLYAMRIQSLQAVDEMVELIVRTLEYEQLLNNTYVFYTSDHGFHLGQHRLVVGKKENYEEDLRVPFFVRGPTIDSGLVFNDIILNIDFAPTILELAGITPPDWMDGTSFAPLLMDDEKESDYKTREYVLLEGNYIGPYWFNSTNNTCHSIRFLNQTYNWQYSVWYDDSMEFYDINSDPYELHNLILENDGSELPTALVTFAQAVLPQYLECKGPSCQKLGYTSE